MYICLYIYVFIYVYVHICIKICETPLRSASYRLQYEVVQMLSMYTGATSQHRLIWAATWMEHIAVYYEISGTQVVIDLFEFLGP